MMAKDGGIKKSQSGPARRGGGLGFNFIALSGVCGVVSAVLVLGSLLGIGLRGFNYGIDFSGGTQVQLLFEDAETTAGDVREFLEQADYKKAQVQSLGAEGREFLIRVEHRGADAKVDFAKFFAPLKGAQVRKVDFVGPQIGEDLKRRGLLAAFYSLLLVLIYVGLRFDYKYAPGAVVCLFHDSIITLGIFALFAREVNVQTMAAILTIIGYSLNDTIVTFDRIRENVSAFGARGVEAAKGGFSGVVNRALNDVLTRTVLTSVTTLLAVFAMYFFAQGVIRDFAFTLGIGVVVGTYSSIFVASPLVIWLDNIKATPNAFRH